MTQNPLDPDKQTNDEQPTETPAEQPAAETPAFEAPAEQPAAETPAFEAAAEQPAAVEPTHAAPADEPEPAQAAPADEPAPEPPSFGAPPQQPSAPEAPYGAPPQGQPAFGVPDQGQPGQPQYGMPPQGGQYSAPNPNDQLFQGQEYNAPVGSAKSKIVAGILGILLGALGIHNFYLGYMKKAIIQLLISVVSLGFLSWISAIWGLIEGILILISKPGDQWHRDAAGVELTD